MEQQQLIVKATGHLPPSSNLSIGTHIITATATDADDNVSAPSSSLTISLILGPTFLSVTVADPDSADIIYGNGDTLTVKFSENTNRPLAATKSEIDTLFTFSQSIGDNYVGSWTSPTVLEIRIVDSGTATPQIDALTLTVNPGGNLKNAASTSLPSTATSPALTGSFGDKTGPAITSLKADDPDSADAVFSNGDTITVRFSEATNQPAVTTKANLDALFTFSQSIGDDYSGSWFNSRTLTITIIDAGAANPQVGVLTLTVKETADLKDVTETSLSSTAVSPLLAGTFGTKIGPFITSLVASDPDSADAVYGVGDTIQL